MNFGVKPKTYDWPRFSYTYYIKKVYSCKILLFNQCNQYKKCKNFDLQNSFRFKYARFIGFLGF